MERSSRKISPNILAKLQLSRVQTLQLEKGVSVFSQFNIKLTKHQMNQLIRLYPLYSLQMVNQYFDPARLKCQPDNIMIFVNPVSSSIVDHIMQMKSKIKRCKRSMIF